MFVGDFYLKLGKLRLGIFFLVNFLLLFVPFGGLLVANLFLARNLGATGEVA